MAQNEIVGRADGLFSSYNNLRVNTDGYSNTAVGVQTTQTLYGA